MVRVVGQSERRSEYVIEGSRGLVRVAFEVESEEANMPVAGVDDREAGAELAMMGFNRYWGRGLCVSAVARCGAEADGGVSERWVAVVEGCGGSGEGGGRRGRCW